MVRKLVVCNPVDVINTANAKFDAKVVFCMQIIEASEIAKPGQPLCLYLHI
jgi:hypothetical protein